jgi:hypothetical protein
MRPHQRRYFVLLVISLALHILLYLLILFFPKEETKEKEEKSFQVTLRETPKNEQIPFEQSLEQAVLAEDVAEEKPVDLKPEKIDKEEGVDEEPSPVNNADEMSTNNQDENIKGTVVGGGLISKEKQLESTKQLSLDQTTEDKPAKLIHEVNVIELKKPENLKQEEQVKEIEKTKDLLTSKSTQAWEKPNEITPSYLDPLENELEEFQKQGQAEPSYLEVLSGVKEEVGEAVENIEIDSAIDLRAPGNIFMLADSQLSEVTVPQPFSDKKSAELKLANKYINRVTKQVMAFWINPYKGNKRLMGTIKVQLNTLGYLVNAYVYRESGDKILDISVLDAIRAVRRFEVPDDVIIVERYYQNLNIRYSSIKQEIELMPFETESSTKQEN